jgi:hypothetical protein
MTVCGEGKRLAASAQALEGDWLSGTCTVLPFGHFTVCIVTAPLVLTLANVSAPARNIDVAAIFINIGASPQIVQSPTDRM